MFLSATVFENEQTNQLTLVPVKVLFPIRYQHLGNLAGCIQDFTDLL